MKFDADGAFFVIAFALTVAAAVMTIFAAYAGHLDIAVITGCASVAGVALLGGGER